MDASANQKILIVEDFPAWQELLKVWLKHAGYQDLHLAKTGGEAVELARKALPDCILLDLGLPDMDGMEVCKIVRSIPALGKTPIVMITAHRKDKIMGLEYGADYFVQKSENPAELLATLRAVFRRRELDLNLYRKGDVTLQMETRKVFFRELQVATLTPKTFELFFALVERSPEPLNKDLLFTAVEGRPRPELSRALDILMNRLRKSLPVMLQNRIKSVKGFGYVYIGPDAEKTPPTS
ncbi:MAG: response regulator transcription factor [Elusimicrobia bacterium]|nr:response regulator transcription factor [Elusimicrobiota bacterium]